MHYLYRIVKYKFYTENAHNIYKQSSINNFSTDDQILYRGVFAQDILYETELPYIQF